MENRNGSRRQEQVTHTSVQRKDGGRAGFTGGENLGAYGCPSGGFTRSVTGPALTH